jgi:Carboxypeptidase regulatory-like domain
MRIPAKFGLVLLAAICSHIACTHYSTTESVPPSLKYPQFGESVIVPDPLVAKQIAGKVLDPGGNPVSRAIVEITTPDWSERVVAVFTDRDGRFAFAQQTLSEYAVKITKPGFAPLLVKIRISKAGASKLKLVMHIAT